MTQPRTPDPGVDGLLSLGSGVFAPHTAGPPSTTSGGGSTDTSGGGLLEGAGDFTDGVRATRNWIADRHNWARVGYVVGGVILMIVGAAAVAARPAAAVTSALPTPVGAIAKGLSK